MPEVIHRLTLEAIADRLYRALKNKPCGCGWHPVPTLGKDGVMKTLRVDKTCHRCLAIADYEGSEFFTGRAGS